MCGGQRESKENPNRSVKKPGSPRLDGPCGEDAVVLGLAKPAGQAYTATNRPRRLSRGCPDPDREAGGAHPAQPPARSRGGRDRGSDSWKLCSFEGAQWGQGDRRDPALLPQPSAWASAASESPCPHPGPQDNSSHVSASWTIPEVHCGGPVTTPGSHPLAQGLSTAAPPMFGAG